MSFIPVMGGAEPYFPTALMEFLEEREAIQTIMDMSQNLASDFANVKVEFCDLDGLGWERHPPGIVDQNYLASSPFVTSPSQQQSIPYLPSQHVFHERTAGVLDNVTTRPLPHGSVSRIGPIGPVEVADFYEDSTYLHYTGGISLSRVGSSTRVPPRRTFELDIPDILIEDVDDPQMPQLLHTVSADNSGRLYLDNTSSTPRSVGPIKIPTVPSIPYIPRTHIL
ncbi:hypothetical protein L218DRAFT_1005961 [Marasmius fiardii PR-910]|nr:hypothetical protein L218DRAFT_1005961 [Marasmius fiardii PR-910]